MEKEIKEDSTNKSKIDTSEDTYLNLKDKNINFDTVNINEEENRNNIQKNTKGFLNQKTSYYLYAKLGNTFEFRKF